MAGNKTKPARAIAAEVLNKFDPKRNYAGPILDNLLCETDQRQRATDLVFGSIRNRFAIDAVIAAFSGCPIKRIPAELLNIIRIGVYELIYLPATEEYSIVNEAVENVKTIAGKKQVGFVNALLRQITRHLTNRQILLSQAQPKRTLPQTPSTGCEFDTCFLPDHQTCPTDYLSTVFSLPKWLVSNWLDEFGEESVRQICFASNRRPSIYLRPNRLKTTVESLAERLRQKDIDFRITYDQDPRMIKIKSPQVVTQLPGFTEGLFTVQDLTASQPVRFLQPQFDWAILDLCAAPGVKTTQLAEATGDSAKIIATDIDNRRLEMVRENAARLGINSIDIVPYEKLFNSQSTFQNSKFDCVLLDVPCSNTGVLARRIEARYRLNPKAIKELTEIQRNLLSTAAEMVKPRGKICYSTCSVQKEENSELVRDYLRQNHNFALESENLTLPSVEGFDHDGGYVAIIIKK